MGGQGSRVQKMVTPLFPHTKTYKRWREKLKGFQDLLVSKVISEYIKRQKEMIKSNILE